MRAKMLPERERCRAWATEPSMSTPTRACFGVSVKCLPWYLATTGRLSFSSTAVRRRCSAAVGLEPADVHPADRDALGDLVLTAGVVRVHAARRDEQQDENRRDDEEGSGAHLPKDGRTGVIPAASPAISLAVSAGTRRPVRPLAGRSGCSAGTPPLPARSGTARPLRDLIAAIRRCSANACTVSRVVWRSGAPAALSLRLSTARPKRSCRSISGDRLRPSALQRRGREARPPRRQQRRERLAEQARDLRQHEHAVAGGVVDARQLLAHGVLEHADDVVLVDELVARVEAEDARDDRQREQRGVARAQVGPEAVDEAQRRHRHVGVALGEGEHGLLGLDDVALDAASAAGAGAACAR